MELEEAIYRLKRASGLGYENHEAVEVVLQAFKNKDNKIKKCIEAIKELKTGQYREGSKGYMFSGCCNNRLDVIERILLEE